MDIIGAAAIFAVGFVIAAAVYAVLAGRSRARERPIMAGAQVPTPVLTAESELPERAAALARREDALAQLEVELHQERDALLDGQNQLQRSLEQVSGLTAARAKQLLLKEVE